MRLHYCQLLFRYSTFFTDRIRMPNGAGAGLVRTGDENHQ